MKPFLRTLAVVAAAHAVIGAARADAVTDWSIESAKIGTPPATSVMAIVQTAAHHAVLGAQQNQASAEAAIAAAHRVAFTTLLPAVQATIDASTQAALATVPEGAAKQAGIAAGEAAAQAVLAARSNDGASTPESYRPFTKAGAYVPTSAVAVPTWGQRTPWLMADGAQFRPAPPPAMVSRRWASDFDEVRTMGSKTSTARSTDQTDAARFWDYSLPAIYHGVLRSVAVQPGRDLERNARFFAAAAQAMDDALIAVFDAKYHYNFWRPVTAIRNGDIDRLESTQREPSWASLIESPLHPEYPSGHSILAGSIARVIECDLNGAPVPVLSTTSPTAKGATRTWTSLEAFVKEVSDARIHGGIHFRSATDTGEAMGRLIGDLAASKVLGAH